jgi:hypothetical protein
MYLNKMAWKIIDNYSIFKLLWIKFLWMWKWNNEILYKKC